jgi:hypothetical protein
MGFVLGLDHLAFEVTNREEIGRWVTHLEAHGVSNSGIIDAGFGLLTGIQDEHDGGVDGEDVQS